ncbi:MAG: STAS domain-containing protein [Acidimicrobiales bacterium]
MPEATVPGGGSPTVVVVDGELDVGTAPRVGAALHRLVDEGMTLLTLDCSGLDFVDSQGLGVLVGVSRRLNEAGGALHLQGAPSQLLRVLHLTRLDQTFVVE